MSDVVNCRDLFTCSGCVREDCWWLVFEDFREECSPILAGVPNVSEWFHGPGNCRQFQCSRDMWDIYGILQVLGGGAGGALLGGGLAWNLLGRAYERLRDPNRPPSRWRQVFSWVMRILRAAHGVRQGAGGPDGQEQLIANGQGHQAGDLEEVVQNGMAEAVNYHNLIRNQLMEIQALRQRIEQQERHIREIQQRARAGNQPDPEAVQVQGEQLENGQQDQFHGNQQLQHDLPEENNPDQRPDGNVQEANVGDVLDSDDDSGSEHGIDQENGNQDDGNSQHDHDDGNLDEQDSNEQSEEGEEEEDEAGPPGEIYGSSTQAEQPGFSGMARPSPSMIPRPIRQTSRLDTSDSSNASTIVTEDDNDTSQVAQRSSSRLSQQQQACNRLSRGLPATPRPTAQSPARPPRRPAAETSEGKFKIMIKNKLV